MPALLNAQRHPDHLLSVACIRDCDELPVGNIEIRKLVVIGKLGVRIAAFRDSDEILFR